MIEEEFITDDNIKVINVNNRNIINNQLKYLIKIKKIKVNVNINYNDRNLIHNKKSKVKI